MNYSPAKLAHISKYCGSTVSPQILNNYFNDPRHTLVSIAGALGTSPAYLAMVLAKPEPTVYAPMTTANV
ncbi:MAG: hypothetical protein HHJ16_06825 [Polaromonas sp.]|uniref:hypothetical protein n=1 Tax=Polaromonas sp. TaxID=1869339 RepID=UPI0017EE8132|nr:hypothetical protein [Polaromonas sp.]NMM09969.1 hypothetical protein [Polaromonas sp.]